LPEIYSVLHRDFENSVYDFESALLLVSELDWKLEKKIQKQHWI